MSHMRKKALIIGCGIAGPVVALALQRAGLDAVLYEGRAAARDEEGAFLGLAPNGRDVLATLGIRDQIDAMGVPTTRIAFLTHTGKRLGENPQPVLTIKRGVLTKGLREAAQARGLRVEFDKRLVGVEDAGGTAVGARFADGTQAEGDLLVGADGLRSRTRHTVMPDAPEPAFTGLISVGGYARLEAAPPSGGTMVMTFGLKGFFGYQVLDSGEIYWFENFHRATAPAPGELEGLSTPQWQRLLLELHRPDHNRRRRTRRSWSQSPRA